MTLMHRLIAATGFAALLPLPLCAATLQPGLSDLASIPLHQTQAVTLAKSLAGVDDKSLPLQFAVKAPLTLNLEGGRWDMAPDGRARWRARVSSPGAVALSLEFARFALPEGAELWLYDTAGRLVQGPYTQAQQTPEGKLWTALVPGSAAVLELRVPSAVRDQVHLRIANVDHAFLDIMSAQVEAKASGPGTSGSCNIDVACSAGDDWRDDIRSVAHITIGGNFLCTGQLLNNARQDHNPLLITANHCKIDQTSSTPASSVVAYWNYQASSCGGARTASLMSQNQSGATLLAGDVGTDFTLVRLAAQPSAGFNVYYAGWDARGDAPQSGVAIHHPSGDVKRISRFGTAATAQDVCIERSGTTCARQVRAWQVYWEQGTTEQGSSGGGLWNQDHQVVGVLSGGNASCSNIGGEDYFARLSEGFTANSAASGQLKAWLDPGDTGTRSLTGFESPAVVSEDDAYTVMQGSAETSLAVLSNDSARGGSLSISAVGMPNRGGSVGIQGGSLHYQPAASYSGTETFSYTASNGTVSDTATVTVTVIATTVVTAIDDAYSVVGNGGSNSFSVLGNDTTTGSALSISAVGTPSAGGSVSIASSGLALTYTPASGYVGTETFSYTASDGSGSDTATVTVTVTAPPEETDKGGGGSPAPMLLALFAALGLLRRRRR